MDQHTEYQYKSATSDTVIVFVHGINGSPLQFEFLVESLNGTYSIENLLLPGHGSTMKEFTSSGMAQWQDYVDEKIRVLQEDYNNIILVGHSMGSLLSVQAAISYPDKIRGLFLMATPLTIHFSLSFIKNSLTVAFSNSNKNEMIDAARRVNSVSVSSPFGYITSAPRYIELLKKCSATRQLLSQLHLPIVMVHSAHDEIVSSKALQYAKDQPNIHVVILDNSGHYYYAREDKNLISNALQGFIMEAAAK